MALCDNDDFKRNDWRVDELDLCIRLLVWDNQGSTGTTNTSNIWVHNVNVIQWWNVQQ